MVARASVSTRPGGGMATQRWGTVSYPGSTPGWASNVSNEEDSDPAPFLSLTEMHQGVSMRQAESTYFCLATRDGSLSQAWSLVDRSEGGRGSRSTIRQACRTGSRECRRAQ